MNGFCTQCGGHGFCLPGCDASTPQQQYHQRCAWHLRIMRDLAKSDERRQYWANELAAAEAKITTKVVKIRRAA